MPPASAPAAVVVKALPWAPAPGATALRLTFGFHPRCPSWLCTPRPGGSR